MSDIDFDIDVGVDVKPLQQLSTSMTDINVDCQNIMCECHTSRPAVHDHDNTRQRQVLTLNISDERQMSTVNLKRLPVCMQMSMLAMMATKINSKCRLQRPNVNVK